MPDPLREHVRRLEERLATAEDTIRELQEKLEALSDIVWEDRL